MQLMQLDKQNKKVILKNFAPFTHCISETINTQIENAKDPDVAMQIYNVTECSDNYLNTSK